MAGPSIDEWTACRGIRLICVAHVDRGRHVVHCQLAEREAREQRRPAHVGVHRLGNPLDSPAEDVGVNLAPKPGARAAALSSKGKARCVR